MKTESLENELKDEKRSHEAALVKCKELEEQLQRLDFHPSTEITHILRDPFLLAGLFTTAVFMLI
jgi:hypothetical protein